MDLLPTAVQQRLDELPRYITRREVASAAGVTVETVRKWIKNREISGSVFPPSVGKAGTADTYDKAQVTKWLVPYFGEPSRGGPRRRDSLGSLSRRDRRRLTDRELAELRGVTPEGITTYERRYGRASDPFPGRDEKGRRSVAEVAAWFDRHKVTGVRGPSAGTVRNATELAAAFERLPKHCTRRDIAGATGASERTVANWAARPDFPAPVRLGTARSPHEYATEAVAAWCRQYLFPREKA
jgi:transcriptional regulator with XRE-family HTH domain